MPFVEVPLVEVDEDGDLVINTYATYGMFEMLEVERLKILANSGDKDAAAVLKSRYGDVDKDIWEPRYEIIGEITDADVKYLVEET